MSYIKIKINGEEKEVATEITVKNLLEEMQLNSPLFVVEKNMQILPKEEYASTKVSDGDVYEIVGFFGGG